MQRQGGQKGIQVSGPPQEMKHAEEFGVFSPREKDFDHWGNKIRLVFQEGHFDNSIGEEVVSKASWEVSRVKLEHLT